MEELATFEGLMGQVEASFARMAEYCIGAVREYDEGWFWEKGDTMYHYVLQFIEEAYESGDSTENMEDVRALQELTVHPDGSVSGVRFIFDNGGLLSVFGVRLDSEQLASDEAPKLVNEVQALEAAVFGIPDVTEADEEKFFAILEAALEQ